MRHARILLVVLLACCFVSAQNQSSDTGTLFGDVADADGAPLASSVVTVRSQAIAVDQLGRFSVSLRPGVVDVFVSATGFQPFATQVTIVAGKATRVEARLKPTPGAPAQGAQPSVPSQPSPATAPSPPRDFNEADIGKTPQAAPAPPVPAAPPVRDYNETPEQNAAPAAAQPPDQGPAPASVPAAAPPPSMSAREREARDVAVRFSPVWHQRMAGGEAEHRYELCTVFDFDGDWIGNNNWEHAADPQYKIWAFTYYSVTETEDHYYLHYACYHPRDWSLVQGSYDSTLDVLQEKYRQILNKSVRDEVEFNHENDLEGVMVIVDKWSDGGPAVVAAETVAHNHLLRAVVDNSYLEVPSSTKRLSLPLENGHPVFYIESQKHGIHPYGGEKSSSSEPIVVLRYGQSTELTQIQNGQATYDLVPIKKTFYQHAQEAHEPNTTFGTVVDFSDRFCSVPGAARPACVIGAIGGALRGDVARPNAAVAPWVWFDLDDKGLPPGSWFFDPASILVRHFGQGGGEKYLYNPYLGIDVGGPEAASSK